MTSKERATLRSRAMTLQPLAQIGKGGISDALIAQVEELLEAHELIKITVLKNSGLDVKEAMQILAERTEAEAVQALGNKITLYKLSFKDGILHVL